MRNCLDNSSEKNYNSCDMKHSSAPWRKFEHSWDSTSIADSDGNIICSLSIYDEATEENQQELEAQMDANANLMKAAPELLKALQNFVSVCDTAPPIEIIKHIGIACEQARIAIAKATNRNNQ